MKGIGLAKRAVLALLAVGVLSPGQQAWAAIPPVPQEQLVRDIELTAGGEFAGQIVNAAGAGIANADVAIFSQGQLIATAKTRSDGTFSFGGLRGGNYTVSAVGQLHHYRLWAPNTAPPSAQEAALVVAEKGFARGQFGAAFDYIDGGTVALGVGIFGVVWGIIQLAEPGESRSSS